MGIYSEYPVQQRSDGVDGRNTSQCAHLKGYAGDYCQSCRFAFYKDYLRCRSCGANDQDKQVRPNSASAIGTRAPRCV